jgi:preprotein translocase subunit SecD
MKERLPLLVVLILVLAVIAVFLNLDLFQSGYQYPDGVTRRLAWQGEPSQRSLNLREGLDLQGGLQVLLEADMRDASPADLDQAASIIQNRVDTLGVVEPLVQTQGSDKIVVELPGVTDPDLAVRTVGETALLEFIYSGQEFLEKDTEVATSWGVERTLFGDLPEEKQRPYTDDLGLEEDGSELPESTAVVSESPTSEDEATAAPDAEEPSDEATLTATTDVTATGELTVTEESDQTSGLEATDEVSPTTGTDTEGPRTVYPTVLTGDNFRSASVGLDSLNKIAVNFVLDGDGGDRMQRFTSDHTSTEELTEFMPIVLDGEVVSSPRIQASIGAQGQIQGSFSQAEADVLVAQLRSGALPVSLATVGQTRIGPTLGSFAVESAIRGGIIGLLAVMAFMLIYYRLPGFLADIALILYALLVLSLFRLIPVTLTLAGIAGLVLSIGMAVDANILIFERMKEELRSGKRIGAAMDTGFARAWPSIRDSNLSTLITCAILFWFGSQFGASIVKGFAITLALGVLTSMFTAIVVTRTLLHLANRLVLREAEGVDALQSPRLRALFGF